MIGFAGPFWEAGSCLSAPAAGLPDVRIADTAADTDRRRWWGKMPVVDDVQGQLVPYLLPDETLVWTGKPDASKHFGSSDKFLVPFSLLWGGFSIFWFVGALTSGAPFPFALFGVPFVVVGLYFIVGRFVYKARRKRVTAYGLTQSRALVAVGSGSFSDSPTQRVPVDQRRSRDGSHLSVTFGSSSSGWSPGAMYANSGMEFFMPGNNQVGFYDVSDVTGLQDALRRTRG